MSKEKPKDNFSLDNDALPPVPDVIKQNPRKKAIILSSIILSISLVVTLVFGFVFNATYLDSVLNNPNQGVFNWIPGNFVIELMIFWCLPIITLTLISFFAQFLSIFYIWLHKVVKFGRYNYSIVEMDNTFIKIPEVLMRVVIPLLLSFTIGYWVTNLLYNPNGTQPSVTFEFFLFAQMLAPITVILITPLWLLDDSGIISFLKREEGERKLPDIEGPSTYFVNFLTGSAYSLTVVTLISFIISIVENNEAPLLGALAYMIVLFIVEWIGLIYLFEIFTPKLKNKLIDKLPEKLVDTEPKVLTEKKTIAKLQTIDAILEE